MCGISPGAAGQPAVRDGGAHHLKVATLMRNSPTLPILSLLVAVALAAVTRATSSGELIPLSELQLGATAGALAFTIFGIQGLISVALEGQELRPGMVPPHLTGPLSAAVVVVSLLLFADSLLLGYGIVNGWDTGRLGIAAAAGCACLATLFILYKEAFLGDEARFDDREDGVPW